MSDTAVDDGQLHDVVIVGAGLAGSVIAAKLAEAGIGDVVVLEAGNQAYFDWSPATGAASAFTDRRDGLLQTFFANPDKEDNSPFSNLSYAPSPMHDSDTDYFVQPPSGQRFDSIYMRMVGGTMYHWLGIAIRLLPHDFEMRSRYGVGVDWPIDYDELEPWYGRAEAELGVAGDDACAGEAWRSTPYQMPPIPHSYLDQRLKEAVASDRYDGPPVTVTPPPVARNSIPWGGRPACAGSNNCTPICPIQAKYDATVHLKRALGQPDTAGRRVVRPVDLRLGSLLVQVVPDPDAPQRIDRLEYIDVTSGMTRRSIRARTYVLALHAVENAKVLLASNGVANRSDQVGRNLMDHPCQLTYARTQPVHPWRGPLVTGTIDTYRSGPELSERAAIRAEFQNLGWAWPTYSPGTTVATAIKEMMQHGRIGRAISERIADDLRREVTIDSLLEQLPDPSNRVVLDSARDPMGLARPKLIYTIDGYTHAGGDFAFELSRSILVAMGADRSSVKAGGTYVGAGHLLGTHRMGDDPASSVTDSFGRCHDHHNLRLVGCGSFPTIGTANPSLTLVALALRTADDMITELTGRRP
jgi:choline dehydrogenase-like flavoprotein